MSEQALSWLIRSAVGGGALLLVAWWWMRRIDSPARRQRLGEAAVLAALLASVLSLSPGWIEVPVPWTASPLVETSPPLVQEPASVDALTELEVAAEAPLPNGVFSREEATRSDSSARTPEWGVADLILAAFGAAALGLAAWRVGGHLVLWWWLRQRRPIPARVRRVWESIPGADCARLVVSPRVRVPFSCGPWRPTVALPARLATSATEAELLWVLRHELRHLERRDPLSAVLFGVGQCLFFYLPWFWWTRSEVRLCQEFLADQAALEAGGDRVEYADFLAGWAGVGGVPAGATSVAGQGSDLLRRIRMILEKRSSLEARCPRRWLLATATGLLSLAVLLAGVGPAALAEDKKQDDPPGDTKKDDAPAKDAKQNKDEPKDDKPREGTGVPELDGLLKNLPRGLDERQLKMVREQLETAKRQMEQAALRMSERVNDRLPPRVREGFPGRPGSHGRLGVTVSLPSSALAEQLDLQKGQGLVIDEVAKDSPAEKVGLKTHDVLVEMAGKPVSSRPDELMKQLEGLEANKAVDLVVLRKGKKETLKGLMLPEPRSSRGVREAPSSVLNLTRMGDQFTLVSREGTKTINLRGKLKDGKAESLSITITEGRQSSSYDSVEKVPEGQREEVKGLLALCEKKSGKDAK